MFISKLESILFQLHFKFNLNNIYYTLKEGLPSFTFKFNNATRWKFVSPTTLHSRKIKPIYLKTTLNLMDIPYII